MKTQFIILISASLILFVSCKKKCDDYGIGYGTVHSVNSPDTISVGESVDLDVYYNTSESSQNFESFGEVKNGFYWKININISSNRCDGSYFVASTKLTTYQFQAEQAGTYILDFGKNSLIDTVVVQ